MCARIITRTWVRLIVAAVFVSACGKKSSGSDSVSIARRAAARRDTVRQSIRPSLAPYSSERAMVVVGWAPTSDDPAIVRALTSRLAGYAHCESAPGYLALAFNNIDGMRGSEAVTYMDGLRAAKQLSYHVAIYDGGTEVAAPRTAACP